MSDSHLIRVFEGETEMRWGDLDAYGHVNNVRFFDYFQEARIIWLTRAQVRMDDPQSGFVVVHISCDFFRELCYPTRLCSMIDVVKTGRSSITLQQSVVDFGEREILYGKGRTTMAWRDHQSGRSTAMSDNLTARLLRPLGQN